MMRVNDRAEERLIGVFVFLSTFIIIGGAFILLLTDTTESGTPGYWDQPTAYEIMGTSYSNMTPEDGYLITSDNVTDQWSSTNDENLIFWDNGQGVRDIELGVIRDNVDFGSWFVVLDVESTKYQDYIMAWCDMGVWYPSALCAISLAHVIANQVPHTNISTVYFWLGSNNYTMFIQTPGPSDYFSLMVWGNTYKVTVGVPLETDFDEAWSTNSMWDILKAIATAQLPDVGPVVNLLISVPFWGMSVFSIAMIASRFIPLISGG